MNLPQEFNHDQVRWHSACCVVIVEKSLFFILRSETMPTHAGQVGFIGGASKDNESVFQTALREFEEEVGFQFKGDFLGYLNPVYTGYNKLLIPICLKSELSLNEFSEKVASNGEWDESFFIPIDYLKKEGISSYASFHLPRKTNGGEYPVYFFPIQQFLKGRQVTLWGASAAIVLDFLSKS